MHRNRRDDRNTATRSEAFDLFGQSEPGNLQCPWRNVLIDRISDRPTASARASATRTAPSTIAASRNAAERRSLARAWTVWLSSVPSAPVSWPYCSALDSADVVNWLASTAAAPGLL
ncbi:hypothetical protein ACHIPZ_14190 [Antrihabitans sp. NCIMB 15449]|uniref:Uncharacterized protein n=1 Tax=Antrihabitans spumae TaxID=3373370 RepID=A0ABW7JQU2_9NOCA